MPYFEQIMNIDVYFGLSLFGYHGNNR